MFEGILILLMFGGVCAVRLGSWLMDLPALACRVGEIAWIFLVLAIAVMDLFR